MFYTRAACICDPRALSNVFSLGFENSSGTVSSLILAWLKR